MKKYSLLLAGVLFSVVIAASAAQARSADDKETVPSANQKVLFNYVEDIDRKWDMASRKAAEQAEQEARARLTVSLAGKKAEEQVKFDGRFGLFEISNYELKIDGYQLKFASPEKNVLHLTVWPLEGTKSEPVQLRFFVEDKQTPCVVRQGAGAYDYWPCSWIKMELSRNNEPVTTYTLGVIK